MSIAYDKFRAEFIIPEHRFGMACYYDDSIMVDILYACIEELQDKYNDLVNHLDKGESAFQSLYAQEKDNYKL